MTLEELKIKVDWLSTIISEDSDVLMEWEGPDEEDLQGPIMRIDVRSYTEGGDEEVVFKTWPTGS